MSKAKAIPKKPKRIGFSLANVDYSVDPFSDFYLYACGSWKKRHPIPKDKPSVGSFEDLSEANLLELRRIVDACVANPSRYKNGRLIASLYGSFMDTKQIERLAFKPIGPMMEKAASLGSMSELPSLISHLSRMGSWAFMGMYSAEDERNSSIYALHLYQGGINLPDRDYYLEEKFSAIRVEYASHIARMFGLYGYSKAEAGSYASQIMKLETAIARASRSSTELRDSVKNYNKMSIKAASRRYSNLDISAIYEGLYVKDPDYIVVGQPEFFDKLNKIFATEKIETVRAYLQWNVLNDYASMLHDAAVMEHFDFFGRKLIGQKAMRPRWKRGISLVSSMLGEALGEIYVKEDFGEDARHKALSLVKGLQSSFRKRLEAVSWMETSTKRKALDKLDAMTLKVGYPKKFRDYSRLKMGGDNLLKNFIAAYDFELKRNMSRIGKKVDKAEWDMNAYTVNAYYNPSKNEIVIPAGIFQPPFFDKDIDLAANYGGIGGVIGHEMTHGFDDQGSMYDKRGNLREWWTKDDRKRFNSRSAKVASLYGSMDALPGTKVNGKLTLGENIADLGGIHIAYYALASSIGSKGMQKRIDGFTEEQRFFIAWAQIWKNNTTEDLKKLLATSDPHSPAHVRGLLPVLTHERFVQAFAEKSKLKAPRNKYEDVSLW